MKKLLCVAAAMTVAMSSFGTLASASTLYSFASERDGNGIYTGTAPMMGPTGHQVPKEDGVETKLDITTSWSADTGFASHTSASPLTYKASSKKFYAKAELDMKNVADEWNAYLDVAEAYGVARDAAIAAVNLEGEYTIKITCPDKITNDAFKNNAADSYAWETVGGYSATDFFVQDGVVAFDDTTNTYTLKMKTKDVADLEKDKLDAFFNQSDNSNKKFILSIPNNTVLTAGTTYEIKGTFSGKVEITLPAISTITSSQLKATVYFGTGDKYDNTFIKEATDSDYVRLTSGDNSTPGGGSGSSSKPTPKPTVAPTEAPTETPSEKPTVPPQTDGTETGAKLDYDNHYAYIIGYDTDGGPQEVRPLNNITRAEVATIFFRMLTDESRVEFWTQDNSFSDVVLSDWFNNAVSTAANAGIVKGYEDGTFRPNAPITRAEFGAIASRFASVAYEGEDLFSDIGGHWSADEVNKAANVGWITGYEDGTFRPDQYITRAEAMTLINRVLYRLVEEDGLRDDMITWVDNTPGEWYYANVQEATNSHTYEREAIGSIETWSAITAPRDWEALEKETSTAASAGKEESVVEDLIENATEAPTEEATEAPAEEGEEASEEEATEAPVEEATEDEK